MQKVIYVYKEDTQRAIDMFEDAIEERVNSLYDKLSTLSRLDEDKIFGDDPILWELRNKLKLLKEHAIPEAIILKDE
jgi:hypothetical protein